MALVPLSVAPVWRPWALAGVTHLLLESAVRERLSAPAGPPVVQQSAPLPDKATGMPQPSAFCNGRAGDRSTASASFSASSGRESGEIECVKPPPSLPLLPDPATWPAPWRELLGRCGSPRPRILWTYPGLDDDLGGRADDGRRDFFRRLFRDLAMPKGSHAFWPLRPYREAEVDAVFFHSGAAVLNPESVILMCDVIPQELALPRMQPFQAVIRQGRRYVQTRDPACFVPHEDVSGTPSARYARLLGFLKTLAGRI